MSNILPPMALMVFGGACIWIAPWAVDIPRQCTAFVVGAIFFCAGYLAREIRLAVASNGRVPA
ncbi:hypothetical protein [Shinella granuli]|uniref:hypothetical protein n=1 Tax=Shinella granuli TaxID=323621 RepID=UPI0010559323|nr:hypothetical protein [Shinella granuli]